MEKSQQVSLARQLRRNQTEAEKSLWLRLRTMRVDGIRFRRQHPLGEYIVDFVSLDRRLIIEIDGGQHSEEARREYEEQRTVWLEKQGYQVIRFWDTEVLKN